MVHCGIGRGRRDRARDMAHHLVLVMPCPTARARPQALDPSRRRRGLTNAAQRKATAVVKRSRSIAFGSCTSYNAFFHGLGQMRPLRARPIGGGNAPNPDPDLAFDCVTGGGSNQLETAEN